MKENVIHVQQLNKTYSVVRKSSGLSASLKSVLRREYTNVVAVKDVSFDIKQGELVGFLGPNGAGKTTTLKMLSGILHPSSGEATVLGHVPWKREFVYQRQFALVMGQKNQLWLDLPPVDSFELNRVVYQIPQKQYTTMIKTLSELLDIESILTTPVRKLSLGQRMKCELIAALLHRPKVLFLDEPTIGLDVVSQQAMREFIADYNRAYETTILLTSHYMKDVERLCSRVIVIDAGSVLFDGQLSALFNTYVKEKRITITSQEEIPRSMIERYATVIEYQPHRVVCSIPKEKQHEIISFLLKHVVVEDLTIQEVGVEEVIHDLFSAQGKAAR